MKGRPVRRMKPNCPPTVGIWLKEVRLGPPQHFLVRSYRGALRRGLGISNRKSLALL